MSDEPKRNLLKKYLPNCWWCMKPITDMIFEIVVKKGNENSYDIDTICYVCFKERYD